MVKEGVLHTGTSTPGTELTADERRILSLLAAGHTFDQVAVRAGFSERTVRRRVESVRRTLGANTTIEAVVVAVRRRLV